MGERSIKRLRLKFIITMLAAFFATMALIAIMVNMAYSSVIQSRMDGILDSIIQNDGELSTAAEENMSVTNKRDFAYFTVYLDKDGKMIRTSIQNDPQLREDQAYEVARKVLALPTLSLWQSGSVDDFYYKVAEGDNGGRVIAFADGAVELGESRRVSGLSLCFLGAGLLFAFVLVLSISKRAIKPEIEAARRQSEFITNASHELKTPLAVIRANTEVEEAIQGESEWSQSTLRQVDYLDGLVKNLVEFARADEGDEREPPTDVNVSEVVGSVVHTFQSVAAQHGVTLTDKSDSDVIIEANKDKVSQLVRLLVDNATKYCDEGGQIVATASPLRRSKALGFWRRGARIVVSNTYANGEGVDYDRMFERFYRGDNAHSNQTGYGVGLSIAQRICEENNGSIKASWKDGVVYFTCVLY